MYRFRHRDALLERLENQGRKERVPLSPYTVDHIMPQGERLPETWKAELGPDWAQTWQSLRHTLGNLTLTAFNPEMGNRPFRDKRDAEKGYRDSPLQLNADLRQTDRWDGDSIRARGARLADDAVGIWKRPVLPDRVLEPYRTPRAGAGHYTIEHHPHLRPGAPMHDLFEAVRQEILALAPEVREEFRRHYVAYKTRTNFTDIVPQKRRLLLTLNVRFDEISDPRGLAADVTNLGLWGNGDVQLEVDNTRQIAYAMELVRQAFAAKLLTGVECWPLIVTQYQLISAPIGVESARRSTVMVAGGAGKEWQKMSTSAAVMRATSMREGAFSRRLMVGCEQRSRPLSGAWPEASLMVWMPPPDGIAMCQSDVSLNVTEEGGHPHGECCHHRRRSGKAHISASWRAGGRLGCFPEEADA